MKGKIIKKLPPTPGEYPVDEDQIRKVLVNMVLNANDALREGGEYGSKPAKEIGGQYYR